MSRCPSILPGALIGLGILALPGPARAQRFAAPVGLPGTTQGEAVAVADFNNDGRPDILVVTSGNSPDILYVNQGGSFTPMNLPGPTGDGLDVVAADLDGDGDTDAFVGTASTYDYYYRNDGALVFTVVHLNGAGMTTTAADGVAAGDLDGDGDLDVAVATSGGNADIWYKNNGVSGQGVVNYTRQVFPGAATYGSDVAIGDITGDGIKDVYVATSSGQDAVYIGSAGGIFSQKLVGSAGTTAHSVVITRISGAKDQAFVGAGFTGASGNGNDYKVIHFISGGNHGFTVSVVNVTPAPASNLRSGLVSGDFDNDGDIDFLCARRNNGSADPSHDYVYNNAGGATGALSYDAFTGSPGASHGAATGDLDGDGDLDVVVATAGAADLIYYNNTVTDVDTDRDGVPNSVDADDDNDGVPDTLDPSPLNPYLCGDSDGDGCDDCSVGLDGFGPLSDKLPLNDGPDNDGDGLCDVGDPDDDNDGIPDVYEVANGLNPLVNDAGGDLDNDSLSNLLEYQSGNDPRNRDSDADGMPDGWEYHQFAINKARIVPSGSAWRYLDNGSNQGTAYQSLAFDDSAWLFGKAELGYGDGGEATVVSFGGNANNKHITTYFRKKFFVHAAADIQSAAIFYMRDDGLFASLNGNEILRDNLPGGTITHTTRAVNAIDGAAEGIFYAQGINPYVFVSGDNLLSAEIHQVAPNSDDISFDAYLEVTYTPRQAHPLVDNDGDGVSNLHEYISGTDPNDPANGGSVLSCVPSHSFCFLARKASGIGYSGLRRLYTVEYRDSLSTGSWLPLPGYTNIEGNNQVVTVGFGTEAFRVYRTRVELVP